MVFFGFFWFFWDDILTLNLNTKKKPKNPKKNQKKNQKNPTEPKKPVSNFECWPRSMPKKNQKKPKKTKKNQKKPKKTSFQFRILAKTNAKKSQKKPKKTKKNQCQFGNLKKPKKTKKNQKKNQCQFTDFGVATGFFWFFLGEHPPSLGPILKRCSHLFGNEVSLLICHTQNLIGLKFILDTGLQFLSIAAGDRVTKKFEIFNTDSLTLNVSSISTENPVFYDGKCNAKNCA